MGREVVWRVLAAGLSHCCEVAVTVPGRRASAG